MLDNIYIENFRRIEKAFLPIRDGITVLCGDNGTGKSTIIEALLFNQYGKPKDGTTKDSIPRTNRPEGGLAYTSVDFTINDTHYRCRRFISAKGSTLATLYSYTDEEYEKLMEQEDIRHLDKKLGTPIATSATGVTAAITQLMGLDYTGYKASLVATQKELDSLASLTKEKRKQFFLDLLGYSKLDKIRKSASQELSTKNGIKDGMLRQSYDPDALSKQLEKAEEQLDTVNQRYAKGNEYMADVNKLYQELNDAYDAAHHDYDILMQYMDDNDKDTAKLESLNAQKVQLQKIIDANKPIAADYDATTSYAEKLAQVQTRLEKARSCRDAQREVNTLTAAIADDTAKLEEINSTLAQLTANHAEMPDLDQKQAILASAQQQLAIMKSKQSACKSDVSHMEKLIDDVQNGKIAKCPTCGSEIASDEGKAHLESELAELSGNLDAVSQGIPSLESDVEKAQREVTMTRSALRTWHDDDKTIMAKQREKAMKEDSIARSQKLLDSNQKKLDEQSEYALTREEMMNLTDTETEFADKCKMENQARNAFNAMNDAQHKLDVIESSIADVQNRIAGRAPSMKNAKAITSAYEKASKARNDCMHKQSAYQARLSELAEQKGKLVSEVSSLKDNIKIAEKQAKDLSSLLDDIEVWTGVRTVIDSMRETLPARITPMLSDEASRLLAIATGGAYTMLDIDDEYYEPYIYTDEGKRPMSQMSGGEQDIASLCIRIAIAEAILESTGTHSQTLVLDEIFGALDDSRKQEACDALRNLSNVLPRILCITHVEQIKDMADWTFVVEKDENGNSHVRELVQNNNVAFMDRL